MEVVIVSMMFQHASRNAFQGQNEIQDSGIGPAKLQLIPQSMAYAMIAGLPPQFELYRRVRRLRFEDLASLIEGPVCPLQSSMLRTN